MRIHAHGREHRRPRTRVHLTDNFEHKCPKPWAKLGKALGKVVHCLQRHRLPGGSREDDSYGQD